jgi:hypothetical protein
VPPKNYVVETRRVYPFESFHQTLPGLHRNSSCVRSVTATHCCLSQNRFNRGERKLATAPDVRREILEHAMNKDEYQKWVEACRKRANQPDFSNSFQNIPYIRVSNDRYAKAATFEERLTLADRQLLREMGISL